MSMKHTANWKVLRLWAHIQWCTSSSKASNPHNFSGQNYQLGIKCSNTWANGEPFSLKPLQVKTHAQPSSSSSERSQTGLGSMLTFALLSTKFSSMQSYFRSYLRPLKHHRTIASFILKYSYRYCDLETQAKCCSEKKSPQVICSW